MATLRIYTKENCPFSKECKKFFDDKGVIYDEIKIDDDVHAFEEMKVKSNRTDTPQVFINGEYTGSFDDIKLLDEQKRLDDMLDLNQRRRPTKE